MVDGDVAMNVVNGESAAAEGATEAVNHKDEEEEDEEEGKFK